MITLFLWFIKTLWWSSGYICDGLSVLESVRKFCVGNKCSSDEWETPKHVDLQSIMVQAGVVSGRASETSGRR